MPVTRKRAGGAARTSSSEFPAPDIRRAYARETSKRINEDPRPANVSSASAST